LGLLACSGDDDAEESMTTVDATNAMDTMNATDAMNAPTITPGWRHGNTLTFDGTERTYSLYAPAAEAVTGLVIALHGSGDTVEGMIDEMAAEPVADSHGFMLVVPQGLENGWNDEDPPGHGLADDVGFIDALIVDLQTTYPSLPSHKTFAYGFSNGGGLATRLACQSRHVRGTGVIGNYHAPELCVARPTDYAIPGWFGAGVRDEQVPVSDVRSTMSSFVSDLTDCTVNGALEPVDVADLPAGVVCKAFRGCTQARLCEYAHYEHEALPGSLLAMWTFLDGLSID